MRLGAGRRPGQRLDRLCALDRDLLAIAQDTAANAAEAVDLTQARLEGGIAPRTDLRQAEQVLQTAEATSPQQTTPLAQDENLIALLVGAPVDPRAAAGGARRNRRRIADARPPAPTRTCCCAGPTSSQAEYQLRAANADIGVARAELFPRISLTGLLGLASDALGALFSGGAFTARPAPTPPTRSSMPAGGAPTSRSARRSAMRALATYEQGDPDGVPRGRRRASGARHDR